MAFVSELSNEGTELYDIWSKSYVNSQSRFHEFYKKEFKNISANGSIAGCPILTLIKKYSFTSKSNQLSFFRQIYGVN